MEKKHSYDYFANRECPYFPCHEKASPEQFNCLFCYCPLYALGDRCGGKFTYLENGIKDCSGCVRPHEKDNYESILKQMPMIMELAKKP